MSLGSQFQTVAGPRAILTIGSIYVTALNWTLRYTYKITEVYETDATVPCAYLVNRFHGEFDCDAIFTSDNDWLGFLALASGDIATKTITSTLRDTLSPTTTKTITMTGRPYEYENIVNRGDFVVVRLRIMLSAIPSIA